MNEQHKKRLSGDFQKSTKGDYTFGLPSSMNESRSVTTEVADGPFRSVAAVGNLQPSFIGGPSMMPPSLSRGLQYGAPTPKFRSESVDLCTFDSFSKEKVEVSQMSSSMWNVNDHTLKPKPDFYPLEQTATFVPHSKPSIVASRVAKYLLDRNISVTFNEMKAKAKCVSKDNVEFNVRLFKGKNQFDHGVIVEVQRRQGFSVFYHRDAVAILDAAEGKEPMETLEVPTFHYHDSEKCVRTQLIY